MWQRESQELASTLNVFRKRKQLRMTAAQKKSAISRKRKAGNPGGKPTMVKTFVKKRRKARMRRG